MRPKVVHYWAMKADGGGFIANREVDTLLWTFPSEARGLLTHERDVELFERFMGLPADTTSVLVVRHASAGSRSKWDGDDRRRPLDEAGWEQAEELVRLLSRFGVSEIVSADFVRCEQTVQPLGESLGLVVQREPLFAERGYPGHEGEAEDLLRSYGKSGVNIAVCTQGDVVPDVVQRLAKEDDVELPEPVDAKKASVWALSFDNERLVAAEYFPPPQI
jgi:8-oxo-dGTP diphosphatase